MFFNFSDKPYVGVLIVEVVVKYVNFVSVNCGEGVVNVA